MRRRSDDWINATHILKIAGFDKPARTRILEREVQKGVHEKIQGGYGKYQGWCKSSLVFSGNVLICDIGTWVPLTDGRALAEKNGILRKLSKIFDFVPGDRSPPPAQNHPPPPPNRQKTQKPPVQPRKPVSQSHSQNSNHHNQSGFGFFRLCVYALTKPAYYRPVAEHY